MPLHVHGITRAGQPPPTAPPTDDEPVRLVQAGELAALVSDVPADAPLTAHDAARHLDILIACLHQDTILPLRFGTVAADDEAVRSGILRARADHLVRQLDALDGLVELHLDVDDDEQAEIAEIVAAEPSLRALASSTDLGTRLSLGEEIGVKLVHRRAGKAADMLARLRPLAIQDTPRSELRDPEDPLLRWAFLVPTARLPEFDELVAELRTDNPNLEISYVGPLPPMSFLETVPDNIDEDPRTDAETTGRWGW